MRCFFIFRGWGILGGIETLIARMSRWLVTNGHEVTVLVQSDRNLGDLLPKQAHCIALGGRRFRELFYYFHARRLWKALGMRPPEVIKSFDMESSWIACQLAAAAGNGCKVIAGIYNPNVFKGEYATDRLAFWNVESLHLKNFLENIHSSARFFCCADDMRQFQDVHHQQAVLWPLPIDTEQFLPASRRAKWGKIVSVGRLSDMKQYNLYMIDVVRDLIKKGYHVTWSVYGGGTYESEMRERIKNHGLEGVIELNGHLPYERFLQAIHDAYVFVGMGTAILEASFFGVPNVLARPFDREGFTDGPIYRLPLGAYAPTDASQPTLKVVDEIERILCLSPSEYLAEQELVRSHVQGHEIEASMRRFLKLVREAEPFVRKTSLYLANYPLYLVRRVKRDYAVRSVGAECGPRRFREDCSRR